ncbi:arsenate reductase (glutaredoxin) [Streptococcus porcorum]|uniref:arsenate reductase (glutathione/glutaredoxin) n=1 Tax=Streptococcus porcorum TaxID=701526 RepID=A0ABV2JJ27_9STRE
MEKVTIYHNPACGTSRNTLALLKYVGLEPEVILYLETPPTKKELQRLIADMHLSARDLLRTNVPPYLELGLDREGVSDDEILSAMLREPILINRPIVITSKGTRLCRPSEKVLEILPVPLTSPFVKEDGEVISAEIKK